MLQRQWPPGIRHSAAIRRLGPTWQVCRARTPRLLERSCFFLPPSTVTRGFRFTQCRIVQVSARTAWRHPARAVPYVRRGRAKLIASAAVRRGRNATRRPPCRASRSRRRFTIGNVWTPAPASRTAPSGAPMGAPAGAQQDGCGGGSRRGSPGRGHGQPSTASPSPASPSPDPAAPSTGRGGQESAAANGRAPAQAPSLPAALRRAAITAALHASSYMMTRRSGTVRCPAVMAATAAYGTWS
jgi:hypothetical protein